MAETTPRPALASVPCGPAVSRTQELAQALAALPAGQVAALLVLARSLAAGPSGTAAPIAVDVAQSLPEKSIADDRGSPTEEEPMYKWISSKPYPHHGRFRVWYRTLDGARGYKTFDDASAAATFIGRETRLVLKSGGHDVADVLDSYLAAKAKLKAGSVTTLRYRLEALFRNRGTMPVEVFPWVKAWKEHCATQSVDSQHGIASALRGFAKFCQKAGFIRKAPELPEIEGRKKRGKDQLRIDEARKLIVTALKEGDALALAAATQVLTGLRPGEVMGLRVRDCDDKAALLWVEGTKTDAARRQVEVAPQLRPFLRTATKGRSATDWLFEFEPTRKRAAKDEGKRRNDALKRRLLRLCVSAGVPKVVPHSLRGLHATLATAAGATSHLVAAQLGHTSFAVTARHYLTKDTLDRARGRSSQARLSGNCSPKPVTGRKQAA